jgi:hypothetical protein
MKRHPLIYLAPAKTTEDLFVTQGVFEAIRERFSSGLVEKGTDEYSDLSRAFWSMAHIFDPQVQKKYEDALGIQRADAYEVRLSSTSAASKKIV